MPTTDIKTRCQVELTFCSFLKEEPDQLPFSLWELPFYHSAWSMVHYSEARRNLQYKFGMKMKRKARKNVPLIRRQIDRIYQAMKQSGNWAEDVPSWIRTYEPEAIPNVWQWLQFIYLPLRQQQDASSFRYIAPAIAPYLDATDPEIMEVLQLVIELDNITPTAQTTH